MTARLLELTLFVADVDVSARFYEAVGLTLLRVDELGSPPHYEADLGLQLFPAGESHCISDLQVGFVVDDLAASVRRLTLSGASWTCRFPNFVTTRDPDGNRVNLAQRRDP